MWARVVLTISLCKLCGSPCLCGEIVRGKQSPQRHRGHTENHREDPLNRLDAFSVTCYRFVIREGGLIVALPYNPRHREIKASTDYDCHNKPATYQETVS